MRERDNEMLYVLAAICLGTSGGTPSQAVDNAEAIMRIVNERHPVPTDER